MYCRNYVSGANVRSIRSFDCVVDWNCCFDVFLCSKSTGKYFACMYVWTQDGNVLKQDCTYLFVLYGCVFCAIFVKYCTYICLYIQYIRMLLYYSYVIMMKLDRKSVK